MTHDRPEPDEPEHLPGLPERLRRPLRQAFRPTAAERAELDARLAADAAAWFRTPAPAVRSSSRLRPWVWRAAAALALVVGGWVALRGWTSLDAPAPAGPLADGAGGADVDGSGRVDVLDALHVARALARGTIPEAGRAGWDFNADGRVDRADADALAELAVRIGS